MKVQPYVPEKTDMREFTVKALLLGLFLAVVLGAANAYLGLKAGMTISASFPSAVIAIAAFRLPFFRGSVLEQNLTRNVASVGEAIAAAAIFIIPAFLMVNIDGNRLWTTFHYWETAIILLVGGLIGVLFIIILRRTLLVDADLPFPEGYACYEIVKSGQSGESGAKYVFGTLGLGVLIELLKNSSGFTVIRDCKEFFFKLPTSVIHHLSSSKKALGDVTYGGGISFTSPLASPALMGVGYIIGPFYAAVNFAGSILARLVFVPLALFLNPNLPQQLGMTEVGPEAWGDLTFSVWYTQVRPIAVGAMLVGAIYTMWKMRGSIVSSFKGVFTRHAKAEGAASGSRWEKDLNLKIVLIAAVALMVPMVFIFHYFTGTWGGALVAGIVMAITGFVFAAVGGWLVGIVGNSNQPLSGLTLSTLLIAAVIMLLFGFKGIGGVAAVLGVAAVICCAASMSGDLIQELKVGQLLGATPWKMELSQIIAVAVVAFVTVFPLVVLHEANIAAGGIGIGDIKLPAPQAGLMAQLASGIMGGQMAWGLIIVGMFFSLGLIMISAPSPMLIAVGMYLPFETTFAIFIGGCFKWIVDVYMKKRNLNDEEKMKIENKGILLASGFVAGEAITGVVLATLFLTGVSSLTNLFTGQDELAIFSSAGGWLSLLVFAAVGYALVKIPLSKKKA